MNKTEFNGWWKDYAGRFPSANAWLNSLGDDIARRQLSLWLENLSETLVDDAMEVSRRMSLGTLEPVGSFPSERERTGFYVARAAAQIAARRAPPEMPSGTLMRHKTQRRAKREALPLRSMMGRLVRLMDSGRTREQAVAEVMPKRSDESYERRECYRCIDCNDTGLADVWAWSSVEAYREDPSLLDNPSMRRVMVTPCSCSAGDGFMSVDGRHGAWSDVNVRYDPREYCIAPRGEVQSESSVEAFKMWCVCYFERLAIERAEHEASQNRF